MHAPLSCEMSFLFSGTTPGKGFQHARVKDKRGGRWKASWESVRSPVVEKRDGPCGEGTNALLSSGRITPKPAAGSGKAGADVIVLGHAHPDLVDVERDLINRGLHSTAADLVVVVDDP